MASKSFCKGSKFSYIGLNEVELPVSERSEYPRFFVLQEGKIVYKLFTDRYFEGIYIPSKSGEMIEISRGLRLPQTREGVIRFLRKRANTELESQSKKERLQMPLFCSVRDFLSWTYDLSSRTKIAYREKISGIYASICLCMVNFIIQGKGAGFRLDQTKFRHS